MTDEFEHAETIPASGASNDPCDILVEISAYITKNHVCSLDRFISVAEKRRSWLLYLSTHSWLVIFLIREEAKRQKRRSRGHGF